MKCKVQASVPFSSRLLYNTRGECYRLFLTLNVLEHLARVFVWDAGLRDAFGLKVRGLNRNAYAFLVGTKYDLYTSMPAEEQRDIDKQVCIDTLLG